MQENFVIPFLDHLLFQPQTLSEYFTDWRKKNTQPNTQNKQTPQTNNNKITVSPAFVSFFPLPPAIVKLKILSFGDLNEHQFEAKFRSSLEVVFCGSKFHYGAHTWLLWLLQILVSEYPQARFQDPGCHYHVMNEIIQCLCFSLVIVKGCSPATCFRVLFSPRVQYWGLISSIPFLMIWMRGLSEPSVRLQMTSSWVVVSICYRVGKL